MEKRASCIIRVLKYFGYSFTAILLAVICFLGISWLVMPRAELIETTPFSGEYWHNPYQYIDISNVYNANFHSHTNAWGIFTDGTNTTPESHYDLYKRLGFDIITISDYQSINQFRSTESNYISAYEHGYNFKKTHQLILGANRVTSYDVILPQTTRMKQYFINRLKKTGELVCLTHPKSWGGYSDEDILKLTGYDLFEVLNRHNDIQEKAWDLALSSGKLVYLLANDDSRDISNWRSYGRNFTRIFAETTNAENILKALRAGQHYGVAIPDLSEETFDQRAERFRNLPNVTRFEIVNDMLHIQLNEPSKEVVIIGDFGIELAKFSGEDEVIFDLSSVNTTYIRIKIYLPNKVVYYFNPITRTPVP